MSYSFNNPIQNRIDYLNQQRNMIDQQLQSMQQMNVPPININNQITPNVSGLANPTNYDFNGKWVDNEEQAKNVSNNNLPLILFDNNNPLFYMKNMDGSFKKYKFEEVIDVPQNNPLEQKVNALEDKMELILSAVQGITPQSDTIIPNVVETPHIKDKQPQRQGGKVNG